jgi:hypothetical protein
MSSAGGLAIIRDRAQWICERFSAFAAKSTDKASTE